MGRRSVSAGASLFASSSLASSSAQAHLGTANGSPVVRHSPGGITQAFVRNRPEGGALPLASDNHPMTESNPDKAMELIASEVARGKPVVDGLGFAL